MNAKEIGKSIVAMGECYGRKFSQDALKMFMEALRPYRDADISEAISKAMRRTRFCPSPAEIISEIPIIPGSREQGPEESPETEFQRRAKREEAAGKFLALSPKRKAQLRQIFLDTANDFNRRRAENCDPRQLSKNLAFRMFLAEGEPPPEDGERKEKCR